ncbi:MAG: hypothetical protein DI607_02910 [Sphingomonas hengshuiensis]|nr:MAG: hypothetical protein DI607_02910 [Sphingomonas hengshuiensis]HML42678.1 hypothetical protein [Hyphomicrobium zavarzinii]
MGQLGADLPQAFWTGWNWNVPFMIPESADEESSMQASKFWKAQIAFVLKQAEDGTAIGKLCRKRRSRLPLPIISFSLVIFQAGAV